MAIDGLLLSRQAAGAAPSLGMETKEDADIPQSLWKTRYRLGRNKVRLQDQIDLSRILALLLTNCVALGKLFNLSEP